MAKPLKRSQPQVAPTPDPLKGWPVVKKEPPSEQPRATRQARSSSGPRGSQKPQPFGHGCSAETVELAGAKLASSGLTPEDAQAIGISAVNSAASLDPQFKDLPALVLSYRDPHKPGELLSPAPKWPPFYRLRYLKDDTSFSAQAQKKKLRYTQPSGTGVRAYFPIGLNITWPAVFADSDTPILITEGELKAASAVRQGFACIGLGGVSSYRNVNFGEVFLAELEAVPWVKRRVAIAYDSDFRDNPDVCRAVNSIAAELQARGALPLMITLPELSALGAVGKKTGLDDFLVVEGADQLEILLNQASHIGLSQDLWNLNEKIAYVANPGALVVKATGVLQAVKQFDNSKASTKIYFERVLTPKGDFVSEPVGLTKAWLRWPMRHDVEGITYRPGQPQLIEERLGTYFNSWSGWGVTPRKGNVAPWQKLLNHLFTGAEPGAKEWFLQWCAFPFQYPGAKLFSAAVLHGIKHGTGKSQVGYSLGRLYGKNFSEIKQADLQSNFNEWAVNKQFVLADDITGTDKRADADLLKKLITQKQVTINAKFLPTYVLPDCINYLFTSNSVDALFMDDDDRRYFIHEVSVGALDEEFYLDYDAWLGSEQGASALLYHLLEEVSTEGFNPAGRAFKTQAKSRMQADGLSDLGGWVRQLKEAPEVVLRVGKAPMEGDLFTAKQLLVLYDPAEVKRVTAGGLTRELRRAGFPLVLGGQPLSTDGGYDRYFAVRHLEVWGAAGEEAVRRHLGNPRWQPPVKKVRG